MNKRSELKTNLRSRLEASQRNGIPPRRLRRCLVNRSPRSLATVLSIMAGPDRVGSWVFESALISTLIRRGSDQEPPEERPGAMLGARWHGKPLTKGSEHDPKPGTPIERLPLLVHAWNE